ncbi:MAG TPA: lasso peptide biosynthesis B2 protein [Pyrinomonadaceae bacterium]|nr:lasso peptide biosynthesis B2 protein [Pyrinomonadaceae bacterium]
MTRLKKFAGRGARAAWLASRFVVRDPSAAWLIVRMAFWVALLSSLVRVMPLPRVMRLMRPRRRTPEPETDPAAVQARLAHLLDLLLATDFLCFTPTCWKRAPVLHRFLALRGIETRVLFGVRREGAHGLAGHAWLEAGGLPVLEQSTPDYTVTFAFPA